MTDQASGDDQSPTVAGLVDNTSTAVVVDVVPRAAVKVTSWADAGDPAVALNGADVAPAGTVIELATVSMALLRERETVLPPVGAG